MKKTNEIKIEKEFRIPGTNIILEAGDRIKVLDEADKKTKLSAENSEGRIDIVITDKGDKEISIMMMKYPHPYNLLWVNKKDLLAAIK
jgi:hypothetical protein